FLRRSREFKRDYAAILSWPHRAQRRASVVEKILWAVEGNFHGWARMFLGVRRSIIRFSLASGRRRCSFRKPSGTHPSLNQCAEPLLQRSQEDLRQGDQIKGAIMKHPSTCLVDSTKLPYPCLDHRADTQISEPEGYQLTCRVRGYFQTE